MLRKITLAAAGAAVAFSALATPALAATDSPPAPWHTVVADNFTHDIKTRWALSGVVGFHDPHLFLGTQPGSAGMGTHSMGARIESRQAYSSPVWVQAKITVPEQFCGVNIPVFGLADSSGQLAVHNSPKCGTHTYGIEVLPGHKAVLYRDGRKLRTLSIDSCGPLAPVIAYKLPVKGASHIGDSYITASWLKIWKR